MNNLLRAALHCGLQAVLPKLFTKLSTGFVDNQGIVLKTTSYDKNESYVTQMWLIEEVFC